MRLDKFLTETGTLSRSESKKAAKTGRISINGIAAKDTAVHINPETDVICLDGTPIEYRRFTYIMMNKPDGVLSATEDGAGTTVLDLLPASLQKIGLFPCGRLDKDTVGLLLLTNNGSLSHFMLSPAHHVEKTYRFRCENPLSPSDIRLLENGVEIGEKQSTRPASVILTNPCEGEITVTEGKYHQIKRMFTAIDNKIVFLERIRFAGLSLDTALARGEWRMLTPEEAAVIEKINQKETSENK